MYQGDGNAGGAASNAPPTREEPVWTPLSATAKIVNGKAVFEVCFHFFLKKEDKPLIT